eukprot:6830798-Prymnesium_polylepis.1
MRTIHPLRLTKYCTPGDFRVRGSCAFGEGSAPGAFRPRLVHDCAADPLRHRPSVSGQAREATNHETL